MKRRAVFFDRDGVLIRERTSITQASDIEIFPQAADVVASLRQLGFLTIVITNQTVVSRGLLSFQETQSLHQQILNQLLQQNPNAIFDRTYMCPHHPSATLQEYRVNCECRKPKSGMLLQAQAEFDLDLESSFLVGDRVSDIYAGRSVKVRSFLLDSEIAQEKLIETDLTLTPDLMKPDVVIRSLPELLKHIRESEIK